MMHRLKILLVMLEGLAWLFLFPFLVLTVLIAGLGNSRWKNLNWRQSVQLSLRRWKEFLLRGLRLYRECWWPLSLYESPLAFWRHAVIIEFFSPFNTRPEFVPETRNRILLLKLAHIGDAMHIAPMITALQKAFPESNVDLLVGPWCADLASRWHVSGSVIEYTPHLKLFDRGRKKGQRNLIREVLFLIKLRHRHYSTIISSSTLTMTEWMIIQAANPNEWIGADNPITDWYPQISKRTEPYDTRKYEAERVGGLLQYLGLRPSTGLPGYPVTAEEVAWAKREWSKLVGRWVSSDGPVAFVGRRVVIAPGAGWPGKMWPSERFGVLASWITKELRCRVILTGTPDEKKLGEIIHNTCPDVLNMVGKTSFGQTAGLIKTADLLVCNDSGPLHLAAAFGTPSVSLFGPTIASKWHPPGEKHMMIQKVGLCDGCVGWHPSARCLHAGACMKAIATHEVMEAVLHVLQMNVENRSL